MINSGVGNTNTAERAVASGFTLSEILIENAYGKEFDIKALVTKLTIVESIYSFALTASIDVRDTVNLFEEIRISGQEKVTVTIIKRDKGKKESTKIKLEFYVAEIPLYGKVKDAVQGYTLSCVAKHAFTNHLSQISRSAKGSLSKQIQRIVTGDLQYEGVVENTASSKGNVKLIIPNLKPFTAMSWLMRHSYSNSGSPIFAYESMDGFKIQSYDTLITSPIIGTYQFSFTQTNDTTSQEGYDEQKFKIISMASKLNSSKYIQSQRGAYASTTKVVDIAKKKYYEVGFDYASQFTNTPNVKGNLGLPLVSSSFRIQDQPLNSHKDSLNIFVSENSMAVGNQYGNYHEPSIYSIAHNLSILENIDSIKHTITLNGDLNLSSGKRITINAPKSIDPQVFKKLTERDSKKSHIHDMMISGEYLITSVKHTFDTKYTCELDLKRDYSNYKLDAAD